MENKLTDLEAIMMLRNQCSDLYLKCLRYQSAYGEDLEFLPTLSNLMQFFNAEISKKLMS